MFNISTAIRHILLPILIATLSITNLYADHVGQVDIRYEFNGINYTLYGVLYKECINNPINSVPLPDSVNIRIESKTLNTVTFKMLHMRSKDTLNLSCTGLSDICRSISGTLPGYERRIFSDTVTIPPAPDWVIGLFSGATLNNYNNIRSYLPIYVETTLDNAGTTNNSSAFLPSTNLFFLLPNDSVYYPLVTTDIDNDSIVYEITQQELQKGIFEPYASGYSIAEPLGVGQLCKIDNAFKQLIIYNTNRGLYALGLKIKEYRNSKLISYQTKFLALRFENPPTSTPRTNTYPFPANYANLSVTTCPGKANSVMLSFLDSTKTDVVDVDVITPNLPGWTFNKTITPGAGRADVLLSWNTPLNLTTLPQFFITLRTKDNECPNNTVDYALSVKTISCAADSVWPGDANSDNVVNRYDPLAIAIAYNETGAARTSPTIVWQPQACATWGNVFPVDNVDKKHADCNGNGTADNTDITAINNNYAASHGRIKNQPIAIAQIANTSLFLDTSGIAFEAGKTVQIPIIFGTSSTPASGAYGLATGINIDIPTLPLPSISATGSWLSAGSSTMVNFTKNTGTGTIDWAHARTTHTNASGYGTIGTLTINIPAATPDNTPLNISLENTRVIDSIGREIILSDIKGISTTVKNKLGIAHNLRTIASAAIVPNPSAQAAILMVALKNNSTYRTDITDVTGRIVWQHQTTATNIALPAHQFQSGIYFVKITTTDNETLTLKWVKE